MTVERFRNLLAAAFPDASVWVFTQTPHLNGCWIAYRGGPIATGRVTLRKGRVLL